MRASTRLRVANAARERGEMKEKLRRPGGNAGSTCALHGLPDLGDLPEDVLQDLKATCVRRTYAAGQTIAEMGVQSEFIGIVREGILKMQKSLPDGREHVVGLLVDGDIFGRVFDGEAHFSVEAATDTEVFTFRRAPFEAILLRSPELDRLLLLNLLNELDRARDWMIILANPKVRGRLSGFLLLLCTRFQDIDHLITVANHAVQVKIPVSRTDLAHLLGSRVESISRAFHGLADDGLIEIIKPDLVQIPGIEALSEEAGDIDLGDPVSLQRLIRATHKSAD